MNHNISRLMRFVTIIGVMTFGAMPSQAVDRYVAKNGQTPDPGGQYTNWVSAASNIQAAVTAAVDGDTVWVGPGTYGVPPSPVVANGTTNMVSINKWITVRSSSGNPADTIIDAGGAPSNRCVRILSQSSGNTASTARLSGFTVTNGNADTCGGVFLDILNHVRNVMVDNCIIVGNRGVAGAGGIYGYYWSGGDSIRLLISNTVVRSNIGGGVYKSFRTGLTIVDSRFENNTPSGLDCWNGTNLIDRCVFTGNTKTNGNYGTAITFWNVANSYHEVRNSLFYDNRHITTTGSYLGSAAISTGNLAELNLYNCTIVSNLASGTGLKTAGIYSHNGSPHRIWSSIIRDNYKDGVRSDYGSNASSPLFYFTNSCTYPLTGFPVEARNIDADPKFADAANRDYRITKTSPCLNTGTNQPWMASAIDLGKNRRLDKVYGLVDMGCYEYVYELGTTILVR